MKNDVFIPSPLAEQLKEAAVKQGLTADEVAELDWGPDVDEEG